MKKKNATRKRASTKPKSVHGESANQRGNKKKAASTGKAAEKVGSAARRLLEEAGIEASKINGTGKKGWITKRDVLDYIDLCNREWKIGPAARRLLEGTGIEAYKINGTGQKGCITKHDVLDYINLLNGRWKAAAMLEYRNGIKKRRYEARRTRRILLKGVSNNWKCPYCNINSQLDKAVADHINPVWSLGASAIQNMVLVCRSCNQIKTDSDLKAFCKIRQLVFEEVVERLKKLGKNAAILLI